MSKPYMPLMMGDWIKGTAGMRAEARGVYLRLLLHQYDQGAGPKGEGGFVPLDPEELALIDPEVLKVWDTPRDNLKAKFPEFEPGKGRNAKCEEVRRFWQKQAKNASKGGRHPKANPDRIPDPIPNGIPKPIPNQQPTLDHDTDDDLQGRLKRALDEITIERLQIAYGRRCDFQQEMEDFVTKVLSAPDHYAEHQVDGLRLAFNKQLKSAKPPQANGFNNTSKKQQHIDQLIIDHARRHSRTPPTGGRV